MPAHFDRIQESVKFAFNPNHRHDEEHEREEDRIRAEICAAHRFQSFAAVREGNHCKWYLEGHDFFHNVSEILDRAEECIFIADWWLSPELYLRRPPALNEEWRLDRLLLKKAQQGVKICIMVYKEVTQTMAMSSHHTMHHLMDLHENIFCMRHPDHTPDGEVTLNWSHHEKIIIVDNCCATIGGLDLCFGRWDTNVFPLADAHPTDFKRTLFAGQDFNNARIQDFTNVASWLSNQVSRLDTARMPWHDCHCTLVGPAVMEISQHFVERWNFLLDLKYKRKGNYPMLSFPHVVEEGMQPPPAIVQHPHYERFKKFGEQFNRHAIAPDEDGGLSPSGGLGHKGNMRVQVLRSSADWSHGILPESSILNAYLQMISEANHCIHIENQFFITATDGSGPVKNLIGKALVERILSAARQGTKFRVHVLMPSIPGFAGDLDGNSGLLAIMHSQYASICRGGHSIYETIEREGFDPKEYIEFYGLRVYDRLNNDPERIKKMEENSGVTFNQAQAALARVFIGPNPIEDELNRNQEVAFAIGIPGGEVKALDPKEKKKGDQGPPLDRQSLPRSYEEALDVVRRFEQGDEVREGISDSIAHHALQGQGSLFDEPWLGTEESEKNAIVSELVYSHLKVMIVDDRRVIMGSANINERSMRGDRDSEIAIVVEDNDLIPSRMNGQDYEAARFAATLRRRMWREHLGLVQPTLFPTDGSTEHITEAMQPPEVPQVDETQSPEDQLVMDPLSDETIALWRDTAHKNTEIFERLFHCVPTNQVKSWSEYKAWVPQAPIKPGHLADPNISLHEVKESLDQVKGHLITLPLDFLKNENLLAMDVSVNPATLGIYI